MATTAKGAPHPVGTDLVVNGDDAIKALAEWVDGRPGIAALTTADRDALPAAQLWTGRVIFNTTTGRLERYNGTNWRGLMAIDFAAAGAVAGAVPVLQSDGTLAFGNPTSRVWRSANDLNLSDTAPSLSHINTWPAWLMDAALTERVGGIFNVPDGWATVDIDLWWTNAGGGSGNVVWQGRTMTAGDASTMSEPGAAAQVIAAAPVLAVLKITTIRTAVAVTAGQALMVNATRMGADGSDTLANDAGIIGVMLRRAS